MPRLIAACAAAACLCLVAGPVLAQAASQAEGLTLEAARAMDADKDGRISEAEFFARSKNAALWQQADANGDGYLDAAEQTQNLQPQPITRN